MFPLYIDPGTGSMLFSILIGAAATLYFLSRAVIIKARVFFSGGRAATAAAEIPFVIYCEGKQYWNVFKPVLDEFEKREQPLVYLTSAQEDPVFEQNYRHIKAEYIGTGNKAFARLNFLSAACLLMTTPGLDVFQLKRAKTVKHYAHVLHMPSDAALYEMFGLDYFDSVLLTGDYQAADLRELEKVRGLPQKKLVTVGCTYLDVFAARMKQLTKEEEHPFTVLVSPSWGASGLLSCYGESLLDELAKTPWRIIVRPHPQSKTSEAALLERLAKRYADKSTIQWDFERDTIISLAKADIMISDFSGIVFDYLFLFDKPVLYTIQRFDKRPYDADDLAGELWQFRTLPTVGHELKEELFPRIKEVIQSIADSAELRAARHAAKQEAWMYQGEAGRRIADFMFETVEKGGSK
ncbi:CDP-glycerol glycerophosphotransferase family protein [Breznakiellaceae bacterium SP9]